MSDPVEPATTPAPGAAAPGTAAPPAAAGTPPPAGAPGAEPVKPPDGAAPPAKPAEPMSGRFAAIAKKERELVQRQQQAQQQLETERAKLAEERKALEAERGKTTATATAFERAKAQAKLDPESFLRPIYGDAWYDVLTEYRLNGGKASPEEIARVVREQVEGDMTKRLEAEAAERKKAEEARAAEEKTAREAREAQVLADFRQNLETFGREHAEQFELVNLWEQHGLVFDVIKTHHDKTGKVLSNAEAYALVEKHLEEQVSRANKAKKFTNPPASPTPPKTDPAAPAPATPTLSNAAGSTPAFTPDPNADPFSRAIAAMEAAERARTAAT